MLNNKARNDKEGKRNEQRFKFFFDKILEKECSKLEEISERYAESPSLDALAKKLGSKQHTDTHLQMRL